MGRSVSTPRNAMHVVYLADVAEDSDEFDFFIDCLRDTLRRTFKSVSEDDGWLGREDRIIASNRHANFTVSEYCGLVAVCVVPRSSNVYGEDVTGLAEHWCDQIGSSFEKAVVQFGTALRSTGTASNGEQFFQPIDGVQRGDMGLGFTSKEAWI